MNDVRHGTSMDMFDITKFLLSMFVVAIHIPLLPNLINPVIRTAVPLFFMMSSYFFWRKVLTLRYDRQPEVLGRFLKRNLRLYGFWFVALLPITLKVRGYFSGSILSGLLRLVQDLLFYSTFRASWYIMALCIGMVIIFYVSRKISDGVLLVVSGLIHLIMCLFSNYYGLIEGCGPIVAAEEAYKAVFVTVCNSFPVSFLWILLGKRFAEGKIGLSRGCSILITALSFVVVCVEHVLVLRYDLRAAATDYYVFLVPLCIGLFSLIQHAEVRCKCAPVLRKMSTIMYVLHSSAIVITSLVCRRLLGLGGVGADLLEFLMVILLCIAASVVFLKLEDKRGFHWLRWAR